MSRAVVTAPTLSAAGATASAVKKPRKKAMVIAAFQVLGVQSKVSRILSMIRDAYQQQTGQSVLRIQRVDNLLGQYGVTRLGNCEGKPSCLVRKSSSVPARQALYINAGGFGGRLIFEFVHLDLVKGKLLRRFNQNFAGMSALRKTLPLLMKKVFPHFGKVRFVGTPKGAQVYLNQRLRGSLPLGPVSVSSKLPLKIRVTHPGYKSFRKTLPVKANGLSLVNVKLAPIVVLKPPTPVFKTWWFWTLVGAGAVAVGTGVTVGVIRSQNSNTPQIRLPL